MKMMSDQKKIMEYGPTLKDIAKAHIDVIPGWTLTFIICLAVAIVRLTYGLNCVWQDNDLLGFFSLLSFAWLITIIGFLISLLHNVEINKQARAICRNRKSKEYSARY